MRYCSRCVMPETAETLTFDAEGVCSVCRQIEVQKAGIDWAERGRELDRLIAEFRGNHDYDCIVPLSGGKDSTFTLWYLVAVKKLRPLVEDMLGMLDDSVSDYRVEARDLLPYTFPPSADLRRAGTKSVFLGYYIPWDVKTQVEVIKRELDWQGDEVEGVPPQYDYEKHVRRARPDRRSSASSRTSSAARRSSSAST